MLNTLQQYLNDPELTYLETLQELWSGYGEIARYFSPKLAKPIIVKSVIVPEEILHPRGWHSVFSHQRKLDSYRNEVKFYQNFSPLCSEACYVPQLYKRVIKDENKSEQILIMEDLTHLGYLDKTVPISSLEIKAIIRWLAYFHMQFLDSIPQELWPIGSYWYLATRPDEYDKMPRSELKKNAQAIDETLNSAQYKTLIHGDAKLANFCIKQVKDPAVKLKVAAVDFQYVGGGVGIKDLAYFLGSCLTGDELFKNEKAYIDYYFGQLHQAGLNMNKNIDIHSVEREWRQLYSFANADFHRFLAGWNPEHYKINQYLKAQTKLALEQLSIA